MRRRLGRLRPLSLWECLARAQAAHYLLLASQFDQRLRLGVFRDSSGAVWHQLKDTCTASIDALALSLQLATQSAESNAADTAPAEVLARARSKQDWQLRQVRQVNFFIFFIFVFLYFYMYLKRHSSINPLDGPKVY